MPSRPETKIGAFLAASAGLETGLRELENEEEPRFYRNLEFLLRRTLPSLYEAYDGYVASVLETGGKQVTCRKGCSACCRHFVSSVEPFEILAIHFRIRGSQRYPDILFACHDRAARFESLKREEGEDEEADDRALYRYFLRGAACPFLGKGGECGIYAARPMSCRMFFAESPPRYCEGREIASPWNRNFQVELPEEAEEALARCSRLLAKLELPESLFAGLPEANARFGKYEK